MANCISRQLYYICFLFSLTWDRMEVKISKRSTPLALFIQFQHNFMVHTQLLVGYWILNYLAICQLLKIYGALNFFLTQDHIGLEVSKRCLSSFFHLISVKLHHRYPSVEGYWIFKFLVNLATIKIYGALIFCLTQDHMGLEMSKRYSI